MTKKSSPVRHGKPPGSSSQADKRRLEEFPVTYAGGQNQIGWPKMAIEDQWGWWWWTSGDLEMAGVSTHGTKPGMTWITELDGGDHLQEYGNGSKPFVYINLYKHI